MQWNRREAMHPARRPLSPRQQCERGSQNILVQLTAPPVAIPFASVGEAHVEKEGRADKGLTINSGRTVLRRILSLQQESWFQDTGMVWWLEWRVVKEL
jgi:hypothetical protein